MFVISVYHYYQNLFSEHNRNFAQRQVRGRTFEFETAQIEIDLRCFRNTTLKIIIFFKLIIETGKFEI